jgi:hypothetical protein
VLQLHREVAGLVPVTDQQWARAVEIRGARGSGGCAGRDR